MLSEPRSGNHTKEPLNIIVPTLITTTQAGGLFVIKNLPPNSQLWVHDAMGRLVYFSKNYDNKLNLSTEAEGMYFYKLITPTQQFVGKTVFSYQ